VKAFRRSPAAARRRPGLRCTRGQALVEFAFVVPILLVMIIGVVEFSRAWMHYQVITDAAREGARNAVIANVDLTEADIFAMIRERIAAAGIDVSDALEDAQCGEGSGEASVVEIYGCNWRGTRGEPASVDIRSPYEFAFLSPFIGWATGSRTITLTTSFIMRNE
jgi:hypothetical protein